MLYVLLKFLIKHLQPFTMKISLSIFPIYVIFYASTAYVWHTNSIQYLMKSLLKKNVIKVSHWTCVFPSLLRVEIIHGKEKLSWWVFGLWPFCVVGSMTNSDCLWPWWASFRDLALCTRLRVQGPISTWQSAWALLRCPRSPLCCELRLGALLYMLLSQCEPEK